MGFAGLFGVRGRAPPVVDDKVIVHSDPFARWDGTRWLVAAQLTLPVLLRIGTDARDGFQTMAFQRHLGNLDDDHCI